MSMEVAGVRPAVLSPESYQALGDFRSFRHLFRNLYTHNLRPERVFELARVLASTWRLVQSDLLEVHEFLGEAGGKGADNIGLGSWLGRSGGWKNWKSGA